MSVQVLLNLLKSLRKRGTLRVNLLDELRKSDKMRGILPFFAMSLINSIIQEHEC